MEAQACYSLGNTYTLLQDYERAAEFHLRHLLIAQELADRCGARVAVGAAAQPRGLPAVPATKSQSYSHQGLDLSPRSATDH